MIKNLSLSIFFLAALLASSSAWSEDTKVSQAFIDGDIELLPDPDRNGAYRYLKPGLDLSQYDRIIIEPVEFWVSPDSEYKGMKADKIQEMNDAFLKILADELEPDYPVVERGGDRTMVLRLAMNNLKLFKKKRGVMGYIPIGAVAGAATDAYGVKIEGVTIEAELLDSANNEQLGVLVDTSIGAVTSEPESVEPASDDPMDAVASGNAAPASSKTEYAKWEDVEMALRFYAKRFRGNLDAAHGR